MKDFHWIEQLDARREVVRVACGTKHGQPVYAARVVQHRDAWWRIELREVELVGDFSRKKWVPLRGLNVASSSVCKSSQLGEKVLVIVGNARERDRIKNELAKMVDGDKEVLARLTVEYTEPVLEGRMRGQRFSHFFEDHFAAEERARKEVPWSDWLDAVAPLKTS